MLNCLSCALQTHMLSIAAESYILCAIRNSSPGGHNQVPVSWVAGLEALLYNEHSFTMNSILQEEWDLSQRALIKNVKHNIYTDFIAVFLPETEWKQRSKVSWVFQE